MRITKRPIKFGNNCTIIGISGISRAAGASITQDPFEKLREVVYVSFPVLDQIILAGLTKKDKLENGFNIFIQSYHFCVEILCHPSVMKTLIIIIRQSSLDIPIAFYSNQELQTIKQAYGHPLVKALEVLSCRANGNALYFEKMRKIVKIKVDWKIFVFKL